MAETKNTKHRSFRIPHYVDEALTKACDKEGVTRSEYVIALLCDVLSVTDPSPPKRLDTGCSTHVTQEEFEVLQARVDALEQALLKKQPGTSTTQRKKKAVPRRGRLIEFEGRLATLQEHLAPIEEAHGLEERRRAEKSISKKKKRGVAIQEAIHQELERRLPSDTKKMTRSRKKDQP